MSPVINDLYPIRELNKSTVFLSADSEHTSGKVHVGDLVDEVMELMYGSKCDKAVITCRHCGQWGARMCECRYCGAPIE